MFGDGTGFGCVDVAVFNSNESEKKREIESERENHTWCSYMAQSLSPYVWLRVNNAFREGLKLEIKKKQKTVPR